MLERCGSDDSNSLTTKCLHQQQNRSKENIIPHKGQHQQSKPSGKGSKKTKDKKNTYVGHEKLKQTGGGGGRSVVATDSTTSNPSIKAENSTTIKPAKENVTKAGGSHTNVRDTHNKKKKNKDNVVPPTGGPVAHEEPTVAKSESSFVVEHRSSSTGVKAPPPGLTKQPSHTNAVNGTNVVKKHACVWSTWDFACRKTMHTYYMCLFFILVLSQLAGNQSNTG